MGNNENNIEVNGKKKNSFATKCGQFFGNLFVACLAVSMSAIVIALTVRFIMWLM